MDAPSSPPWPIDEAARRRFEAAWSEGSPEPVERFLPPEDDPRYLATLEQFAALELACAWKFARPAAATSAGAEQGSEITPTRVLPCVADYLRRFPQLNRPEIVQRLQAEESRLRQTAGEPPSLPLDASGVSTRLRIEASEVSAVAPGMIPRGSAAPSALPVHIPGYEILGELGRGGMGVVYRARQLSLKRLVALKMILTAGHAGAEDLARFHSEAEAVAQLQHPNIVQVYEIGSHQGLPFFSLEYVEGGSLAQRTPGQLLAPEQAAGMVETLARAMQHAHQRGIVHRDLKPANILLASGDALAPRGRVTPGAHATGLAGFTPKIADFGLAKQLEGDPGRTHSGAVLGTPCYMAPEQAAGRTREVGPLADVYALGAILYELLTGRPPFKAATIAATLEQVQKQDPVPPSKLRPKLPRDLETICLKCLAKEPARRYSSALALAQDLERFRAGEAILARREGPAGKLWRQLRRRPREVAAFALVVALAVAAVGYFAWRTSASQQLKALTDSFNAGLDALDQTGQKPNADLAALLADQEQLLDEIARLAPEQANEARRRLHQRLEGVVRRLLGAPKLPPDRVAWIEAVLKLVAEHAPERAQVLRQALVDRMREKETLFDLPAESVASVFDAADGVVPEGAGFRRTATAAGARSDPTILTRHLGRGNVELEAVFDGSWESASTLGLLLGGTQQRAHAQPITALAFSSDDRVLASASGSAGAMGDVRLLDLASGRELAVYHADKTGPLSIAFAPNGRRLAVANPFDPVVQLLDVASGQVRERFTAHPHGVNCIGFAPDGQLLATGVAVRGQPGVVKLWDTMQWREQASLTGHTDAVGQLAFSPDGKYLATASFDKTVWLWDLATRRGRVIAGDTHLFRDQAPCIRFGADSRTLASQGVLDPTLPRTAGALRLWDVTTNQLRGVDVGFHTGGLSAFALAPDGRTVVASCYMDQYGRDVNLCDLVTGKRRLLFNSGHGPDGATVTALDFSPDGRAMAMGSTDGTVKLWDVSQGEVRDPVGRDSYAFLLRAVPVRPSPAAANSPRPDLSIKASRAAQGTVRLQLLHGGVLLREQEVPLVQVPPGRLRLAASRDGDRLILQVNDLPPLEFQDALLMRGGSPGLLGLHWPAGVRLERLRASHQPLPPAAASALERGDHLFGRGQYTEALVQYQEQALASGTGEVGQEARVKAAYCLQALSRTQEAAEGFERVTAEAGARWPIVAGCELLMIRLRQGRHADADTVFEIVSRRHSFEQLAGLVPQEFRAQLSRAPIEDFPRGRLVLLRPGPHLLRGLERARAFQEFFRIPLNDRVSVLTGLVQSYHVLDRVDDGLQIAQELFDDPRYWPTVSPDVRPVELTERYSYLLRQHGEPGKALARVERQLLDKPALAPFVQHQVQIGGALATWGAAPLHVLPWLYACPDASRREELRLLVERARILAALKRWDEAEKDLDTYLDLTSSNKESALDTAFYMACLLQGFLRERRGDGNGARAAWRRGLDRKQEVRGANLATSTMWYSALLASLLGELTAQEAALMFERLATYSAGESAGALAAKAGLMPPAGVLRTMCGTARGRDAARKLAFQDISYAESLRLPLLLIGAEMLHQGALPGQLSAEQEDILWVVVEKIHSAWAAGKINDAQVLQLALTWKGTTNFLGWAGVKGSLEPALRGPLAYVAGHRYLRLNRPTDAVTFFRTARQDSSPGSALHRLAQAELERLNAK